MYKFLAANVKFFIIYFFLLFFVVIYLNDKADNTKTNENSIEELVSGQKITSLGVRPEATVTKAPISSVKIITKEPVQESLVVGASPTPAQTVAPRNLAGELSLHA